MLAALTLGLDVVAPHKFGAGALLLIPVLAASLALGTRGLAAVLAVVLVIEVAGLVLGRLEALVVGGRLLAAAVVTVLARSAASGLAEAGRAPRARGQV